MDTKEDKPHINVDYFEDLTGKIATPEGDRVDEIGRRIRKLREAKGLSLEDLSNLTGFEIDFLEKIENQEIHPQLGTVIKLSKALESAFGRLVSGVGDRLYSVTRRQEQKIVSRSTDLAGKKKLYTYKSLAPEVKGRHMEPLMVELKEMADQEPSVHAGEEFIHVLDGTVVLRVGDEQFELEAGDSAYYLSTTRHLLSARNGKARILAVIYGE